MLTDWFSVSSGIITWSGACLPLSYSFNSRSYQQVGARKEQIDKLANASSCNCICYIE